MRLVAIALVIAAGLAATQLSFAGKRATQRKFPCGHVAVLKRDRYGDFAGRLWTRSHSVKIEVRGFRGRKRARAKLDHGLAGLSAGVMSRFQGTVMVRAYSCATHRRVWFWAPPAPGGVPGGPYPAKSLSTERTGVPYDTDLLTSIDRRGRYELVASLEGRIVGKLVFRAVL